MKGIATLFVLMSALVTTHISHAADVQDHSAEKVEVAALTLEKKSSLWSDYSESLVAQRERELRPYRRRRHRRDHARFRGGIAISGGGEFLAGFAIGMGGIDGRLGIQINDLFAIYTQLHLSFGGGSINGQTAITGTFAATLLAELTLFHRLFVGLGGGYGVLNSPHGPAFHLRFGGYPALGMSGRDARRKGLMLGVDARVYVVLNTAIFQTMLTVGYEAF